MALPRHRLLWAFVALLSLLSVVAGCSDLGAPLRLLPRAELSASSLDFGTVFVRGAASLTVGIGNSGEGELHGVAALTCTDFSIESGGGAYTVGSGGHHDVVVRYSPTGVGASSCQLQLGEGLPSVALSGTGAPTPVALCVASVGGLDFGTITLGGNKLDVFKLYSRGTVAVDLDVTSTCTGFTLLGGGGAHTLAPGDSLLVTVQFAPSASGHFACSVTTGTGNPVVTVAGDVISASFAGDIRPIFNSQGCASCHGWTRADQLVNVQSSYGSAVIIAPGDLAGSVLYQKVANTHRFGGAMPQGTSGLPAAQLTKVRNWILEGARDN